MKIPLLVFGGLALALSATTSPAATYNGNGATGFSGAVGDGILTITANAAANTYTFTLAPGNGQTNLNGNDLVIYIDSQAGGFSDTSTFQDNGDGERRAVSGYNDGTSNNPTTTPTRSLVTFANGFTADYALDLTDNFTNLFTLASGTNNSFGYQGGSNATPESFTFASSLLGIPSVTGASFKFVGSLVSETAFRSNEVIADPASGATISAGGSPGFTGAITFAGSDTSPAPEPGTYACIGAGAMMLMALNGRRCRRA